LSKRLSKMWWIVLAALLIVALVALPACTTPPTEEEEEEEGGGVSIPYRNDGIFVEQTIGLPETLDPAAAYDTSSGEQMDYVYEPLIDYDGEASAEFIPVLATEWTWSDADLTWTFTIRDGVKFHEGGDLSPEDVEYTFEREMIYDRLGGPQWMLFEPLLGCWEFAETTWADVDAAVEVVGDSVVFHLVSGGYKLIWLQTICSSWGMILDKEWCIANGEWDGTEADIPNHYQQEDGTTYLWNNMNGTGPWKLNEWDQAVQIKLERFDDYWGDPAPFDFVITQLVEEWTTRKQALLAGDADFVDVPRPYIHELDGITDLTTYEGLPELSVVGMFMNFDISPTSAYIGSGKLDGAGITPEFFSDIDVRKGFCYAFDYDTMLNDVMLGEAIQPGSPVVQGLYGFNPDASRYTYDPVKAEEHLKAAWGGQVWENGFTFTLLYNAGNDVRKSASEILAEDLYQINPKFLVTVLPLAWSTGILPLLRTHDLAMYCIGWGADYPHAHNFIQPFMSTAGTYSKFQSYGSAELDAKITAALLEPDPLQQLDDYFEIQQIFYDDAPGWMLYQPTGRRYFTKYIHGFYFNPMIPGNVGPLYYMTKSQ
jgi:peptide/nickel transport system substrate-binding protein